ncbi:Peptidase M16-like [hydrothermal vent metagenome]|uniref:Peptidase M16-like n=1 Tax=hydrothermal vent metagenome TaxID=652676 RepID=A0A3B0VPJ3_9ZZZZ
MLFNRVFILLFVTLLLVNCSQNYVKPDKSEPASKSQAGDDKVFNLPYLMRDLDNGLRVIVVPTDYPEVVTVQIPVQTGSRNEVEPGKSGFAHFFEHMMFHGTPNYTSQQYSNMMKNAGADSNAYTTDDYTNYHTTITKDDLETLLMLEADKFQNLTYTEAEFRTEALAVKGEYLKNSANPFSKLRETIRKNAFSKHTYKHTTMGFIEDIEDMPNQIEYARIFFDRWYRPEKTAIIIVGDVEAEATFALVKKYWGSWERGNYVADIPLEPPATGQIYKHIKWQSPTQPWLTFAFHGPADNPANIDKQALDLLLQIHFGKTSEVYQELVTNKQLVDGFYAFAPSKIDPGLIYIAARLTKTENYLAVKNAIVETIVAARTEQVDNYKLADLKSAARYGFATSLDNSDTIGAILARYVQRNRDPELINQQYSTLSKVTADDVLSVANKYLVDAGRIMVSLSHDDEIAGLDNSFNLQNLVATASEEKQGAYQLVDMRNHSPIIDLNLLFNTGSAFEATDKNGVAALTASMLSAGGSKLRSATEISKLMFPMAAHFSNQVDKEMISFSGRVHQEKASQWLDLVLESMLQPGFREDDFKRLKQQQINAIKTDLKGNNDEELGKEVLYHKLYGNHPYATYNLGDLSELESITLADVKEFYQTQLTQKHLTIGITGNLSDELFKQLTDSITRKLAVGNTGNASIAPAPKLQGRAVTIVEKQTLATAVSFGFPIDITRAHKDWVALWLVRSYLGEHRNSNSHLYDEIRSKRGMNYGDYAYIEYFPRGMFRTQPNANLGRSSQIFQIWLRPLRTNNDAHFATRVALYELHHLIKHGLTQEQFESTKNYLDKYAGLLVKSQDRILGYALDSQFYGISEFTQYVKGGLASLTLEQVNQVIKKYLQEDNIHFVFVTKDAQDMKQRLVTEQASPMIYNSEKSAELLKKDEFLQVFPVNVDADNVEIIPVDKVFE